MELQILFHFPSFPPFLYVLRDPRQAATLHAATASAFWSVPASLLCFDAVALLENMGQGLCRRPLNSASSDVFSSLGWFQGGRPQRAGPSSSC